MSDLAVIRELIEAGEPLTNEQADTLLLALDRLRGELVVLRVQLGEAIAEATRLDR